MGYHQRSLVNLRPASVASTAMAASSINVNVVSPALKPGLAAGSRAMGQQGRAEVRGGLCWLVRGQPG